MIVRNRQRNQQISRWAAAIGRLATAADRFTLSTYSDARRPRTGATLEPITQAQPGDSGDAWSATGGAIALGALITIASE